MNKISKNKASSENSALNSIVYSFDEDGKLIQEQNDDWEPKKLAHELAWKTFEKRIEETKIKAINNELSPIAYFMEKCMMTPKRLANYMGIPKRKVKKHLKPKHFKNLSDKLVENYAKILETTPEKIKNFKKHFS